MIGQLHLAVWPQRRDMDRAGVNALVPAPAATAGIALHGRTVPTECHVPD
jgi:hypothetical protein